MSGIAPAVAEGLGVLGSQRTAVAVGLLGLITSLLTALVSPIAGAIAVLLLTGLFLTVLAFALQARTLYEGPYRVFEDRTVWDLADRSGEVATVTRSVDVEWNYPCYTNTEKAAGDGNLFAEFECNYGTKIHEFTRGDEHRALILLDYPATRGKKQFLESTRVSRGSFLGSDEWASLTVDKPSDASELTVIFPADRLPRQTRLKLGNGAEQEIELMPVDGSTRKKLSYRLRKSRVGDEIEFSWSW